MSTRLDPRQYSERELTLRAISVTSQRARATQQELGHNRSGETDRPTEPPRSARTSTDDDLEGPDLEQGDEAELPNPIATDGFLRHYLEQAALYQGVTGPGFRGFIWRLMTRRRARKQAYFNSVVLHALHQFDHRTRLQQRAIARLEAETAAIRRAVNALESRSYQSS